MDSKSILGEGPSYLWQPLLEAAAQTLVGAVASYGFGKAISRFYRSNTFDGAMDLWQRGIHGNKLEEDDSIRFDGLISPFCQLFPADPFENARRWNSLYQFPGKISSAEYQAMEFFAGSDAALRVGSVNGETLVGLYSRYGFIGEGIVGVVPTKLILKRIPSFFHPKFMGIRAIVTGRLSRCPSQHGHVAQAIARRARIPLDIGRYKNTYYIKIDSVSPFRTGDACVASLLGSVWAATSDRHDQYLVQYGYISNDSERNACLNAIALHNAWKKARVYYDDIDCPIPELSFKRQYI